MSVNLDKTLYMYTENEGYTWEEYTAQAIGESLLVCDGYGYEVRHDKEAGYWTLWISSGSRNSQRGLGQYTELWKFNSLLECEYDAMAEIEEMVGLDLIEGGEWPHVGDRVMAVTMSDYNEFYKGQDDE
tara:strand:+ start:1989 stop:2375 length:387 start_codon:yes stop_codon:yes gene_type:complete